MHVQNYSPLYLRRRDWDTTSWVFLALFWLFVVPALAQDVDTTSTATYVIEEGDTLFELAARLGISSQALEELNPESLGLLRSGHTLRIPIEKMSQSYTVKRGDTLFGLARQFGISVGEIRDANSMSGSALQSGAVLTIPGQGVTESFDLEALPVSDAIAVHMSQGGDGRLMENGREYNPDRLSISHPNFPVGSIVWVKSLESDRGTFAEVTERGFAERPLLIDMSRAVADFFGADSSSGLDVQIRLIQEADK